jgi:hypothetical protein
VGNQWSWASSVNFRAKGRIGRVDRYVPLNFVIRDRRATFRSCIGWPGAPADVLLGEEAQLSGRSVFRLRGDEHCGFLKHL